MQIHSVLPMYVNDHSVSFQLITLGTCVQQIAYIHIHVQCKLEDLNLFNY